MTCETCQRTLPLNHFPVGSPRRDGSQHPFHFCQDCWSEICAGRIERTPEQRRAAHRRASREYQQRWRDARRRALQRAA